MHFKLSIHFNLYLPQESTFSIYLAQYKATAEHSSGKCPHNTSPALPLKKPARSPLPGALQAASDNSSSSVTAALGVSEGVETADSGYLENSCSRSDDIQNLPLTSCCASWFLIGHEPVRVPVVTGPRGCSPLFEGIPVLLYLHFFI